MIPVQRGKTVEDEFCYEQKHESQKQKEVWAGPLDLDEKISDEEILYYIEELMKLGRIWEAGTLGEKLPAKQRTERVRFCLEEKRLITERVRDLDNFDGWDLQVDGET